MTRAEKEVERRAWAKRICATCAEAYGKPKNDRCEKCTALFGLEHDGLNAFEEPKP